MIKTMLFKLLRYLHAAVFDKSPDAVAAFRLNRAGGVVWRVFDDVLELDYGTSPVTTRRYALESYSFGTLIAQLRADGFVIERENPELFGLNARALLESSGNAAQAGGDQVMAFTALPWVFMGAFAVEMRTARAQVPEALKQMIIWQAEQEWLDLWGSLYDVPRAPNEPDANYQTRIPEEAFRLRVNKFAIEKAVFDLTGKTIWLRETWGNMFRLDVSRLSSMDRLVDGARWRYGYIEPVSSTLIDWSDVLPIIMRNKAAGVVMLPPTVELAQWVAYPPNGLVQFDPLTEFGHLVARNDAGRLDVMRLGDALGHRNWSTDVNWEICVTNFVSTATWANSGTWNNSGTWRGTLSVSDLDGTIYTDRVNDAVPIAVFATGGAVDVSYGIDVEVLSDGNIWSTVRTWDGGETWISLDGGLSGLVLLDTEDEGA